MKRKNNTAPFIARQGDVLIRSVAALPSNVKPEKPDAGRVVLAYGEVTGHAHAIDVAEAESFTMADAGGIVRRFLRVFDRGAKLKHEEHKTVEIPPGVFEIVQQREYSPEEIRNVAD